MSKITARYVDTCLSDYLQDGFNRPGQILLCASLGGTIEDTRDELIRSACEQMGEVPSSVEDSEIDAAIDAALAGVDLRYIDEDGNPQDEPDEDRDGDEPYVYVVLEWDATVVKVRLTVDVDYLTNGTDPTELTEQLQTLIHHAVSAGDLTGDTDAEVDTWGASVHTRGESPEDAALTYVLNQLEEFKPDRLRDMGLLVSVEKLKAVLGIESPTRWVSTVAGWTCNKCGETRRNPYDEPHGC